MTEADELYQNAGEKGRPHTDPHDPPRRRANQAHGHGTWATDRPPIVGIVGRRSGHIRLRLCHNSDRATLEGLVVTHTRTDAIVNTDEWSAYRHLVATGRRHQTVCHTPGQRQWARDDDGDGIREVHNNTMEGIWTGCRNFLRLFRGVSKWFLAGYVAVFEGAYNLKQDNLTTHNASSFYEHLPADEAFALAERFEFIYTPKGASWLNMIECEFSVVSRQCLDRRIASIEHLGNEVLALLEERSAKGITIDWQFSIQAARAKLNSHYTRVNASNQQYKET
ncbi:MAG TPA: transposase [Roseiflexaceae bacterium]